MTRARERLYLLNARRRYLFGQEQTNQPSRFLKDIPAELLDEEGEQGQLGLGLRPADGQTFGTRFSTNTTAPERSTPVSLPNLRKEVPHHHDGDHNLAQVFSACNDIEVIPEPPEEHDGVFIGMKVRHGKFGLGTIRKIEGSGEAQKVIVWFSSVGPKKLMLRFAGLERA